jgi:glutaredoxin-like protein
MPSALLSERIRDQLRAELGGLSGGVDLRLLVRARSADGELRDSQRTVEEVVQELVDAAPERLRVTTADLDGPEPSLDHGGPLSGHEGVPVLQMSEPQTASRIAYLGIPGGYEFGAVVDTVRRLGGRDHGLSPASLESLRAITEPVEVMVFVTPSCPYCPGAASMAFRLAMASPMVTGIAVEAMEFPELSARHQVSGVPRTVVNRAGAFVGALPEERFVAEVVRLARAHPLTAHGQTQDRAHRGLAG